MLNDPACPAHDMRSELRLVPQRAEATAPAATPALDDSALLRALRTNDPTIAEALYTRARPIVDRTLTRLLGARDPDYEDVVQLALLEIVTTVDRFRGECPLDAWLSILTARVVYRHIRRRRLERRIFTQTPLEDLALLAPASVPGSGQAVDRVRFHLENMDERRAWTFLLHDVYGYDLREIGQIMNVSLAAAQSRLVRGRRELHERVRGDQRMASFFDAGESEEEA
jgi:RNA polymerase sigma-70 factor (ECF subfamily)